MKAIRMQSMLLAILTLGSAALSSCASGDDSGAASTTAAAAEQTAAATEIETTEEDVRRAVSDNVPELISAAQNSAQSRRTLLPMIFGLRKRPATFSTMRSTPATVPLKNASTSRFPRCLLFRSVRFPRM